jgi:hypothetical protein
VTLASGEASAAAPGEVRPDPRSRGSRLTAEISTASPVVVALRKTALLQVGAARQTVTAPPIPGGMLRSFLRYCR